MLTAGGAVSVAPCKEDDTPIRFASTLGRTHPFVGTVVNPELKRQDVVAIASRGTSIRAMLLCKSLDRFNGKVSLF